MASEKITAMIEELKTLTVLELSELVKAVEEEFGVSAAAAVAVLLIIPSRWLQAISSPSNSTFPTIK